MNAKVYFEDEKDDVLYYEDNVTVVDLGSGLNETVQFTDIEFFEDEEWWGYYRFEIKTELAGDENSENDLKIKTYLMHLPDTTPPVTTHTFTPEVPDGENGWYVSDVLIELNATDEESGVNTTYYKIYQYEDWVKYSDIIIITEDDYDYSLYYYSIDNSGNTEDVKGPFEFKIDQTPPTISLSWDNENKMIIADVDDETSGVAKVEFYVNDEYLGEVTEAPWEWYYPEGSAGDIAVAIAYDFAGNSAVSPYVPPPPPCPVLLIGSIRDFEVNNESVNFHANFVIFLLYGIIPVSTIINEDISLENNYRGFVGKRFIFAFFWM